jgi:hypothetical protein
MEARTMSDKDNIISTEQIEQVVKKKRNRGSDWMKELSEDGGNVQPGDNARFVRWALASWDLPPIDISDPEQVRERIGMYFKFCSDNDRRPQIIGMCNWLGISRDTLNEWVRGVTRADTHSDIIKKAYNFMEEMWTDYMTYGKISPPTAIFLAKNWYGYKDVADVVVTPNNPMQGLDADTARQRLIEAIPDEDE